MIKVENNNSDQTRLSYLGEIPVNIVKSKDAAYFSFSAGENLVYTAYTSSYGEVYTDQITDCVLTSTDYLFEIDNASPEQPGNIIGNSEICEDSNGIVFETNIINGVNYIWTFPSDWEIESGANTNAVTVHSGNENGLVTVRTSNGCGSSPESVFNVNIIDKSLSATEIAGIAEICDGSSTTLTVIGGMLGEGAAWYWYKDLCGEELINTGNFINITPEETSTYYLRAEGECNTTECITQEVIINSNPTPTISGVNSICEAEDLTLIVDEGTSWNWSGPNNFESSIQNPEINSITTMAGGTYNVTVTDDNGCSGIDNFVVEIKTLSVLASDVIGDTEICIHQDSEFEVFEGFLGTNAEWHWYSGICGENQIEIGNNITITAESETEYFVRAEGECNTTDCYNINLTINSLPEITLSSNQPICEDSDLEINASGVGSFSWDGPSGFESSLQNNNMSAIPTMQGTYSCTIIDNNGCTSSNDIYVDIKLKSIVPTIINGNLGVCPASNASMSISDGILGDGASWEWYSNNCGETNIGSGVSQDLNTSTGTEYFVRAEGECNSTDCYQFEIFDLNFPEDPTESIHTKTVHSLTWNWIQSGNALGYKVNLINDYDTSIDIGNSNSYAISGCNCYTLYTLYIWAYNECGVTDAFPLYARTEECIYNNCGDTLTYEGVNYNTANFGDDCWFIDNLKYLPSVVGPEINNTGTGDETQYYYVYDYEGTDTAEAKGTSNYLEYGVLYNWYAAMTACPSGWHLPTHNEWTDLERYVCEVADHDDCNNTFPYSTDPGYYMGTDEGSRLSSNYNLWEDGVLRNNTYFNSSNFNIKPGGSKPEGWDSFTGINIIASYWLFDQVGNTAFTRSIQNTNTQIARWMKFKPTAISVRCIKD